MRLREFDDGVTDRFLELRAWLREVVHCCWSCANVIATRAVDKELGINTSADQLPIDCKAEDRSCKDRATELWPMRPKRTVAA